MAKANGYRLQALNGKAKTKTQTFKPRVPANHGKHKYIMHVLHVAPTPHQKPRP